MMCKSAFAHLFFGAFVVVVGPIACARSVSDVDCRRMLDRYVSMSAEADPAVAAVEGVARDSLKDSLIEKKHHEAAYDNARLRCTNDVSRSAYDCAMAAPTANEWEACVQ